MERRELFEIIINYKNNNENLYSILYNLANESYSSA